MFAAFLATILFSVSVVSGHRTAKLIGGVEANFWRLTLATLFLGGWAYTGGTGLGGEAFPLFLFSGLIGIGVGDAGLFQALPRLGSRLSLLLIQCLTAPLAAIVEWLWLGTTLSLTQVLCVVVVLAGVADFDVVGAVGGSCFFRAARGQGIGTADEPWLRSTVRNNR